MRFAGIHAKRIPLNDEHIKAIDESREQLWLLYRDLKAYKLNPTKIQAEDIELRFQTMCSTRNEAGRRCRDTFVSLKKTYLKHRVSFWHYLKDRLQGGSNIPPLSDLILAATT